MIDEWFVKSRFFKNPNIRSSLWHLVFSTKKHVLQKIDNHDDLHRRLFNNVRNTQGYFVIFFISQVIFNSGNMKYGYLSIHICMIQRVIHDEYFAFITCMNFYQGSHTLGQKKVKHSRKSLSYPIVIFCKWWAFSCVITVRAFT